ncbi:MAG: hypothetical protein MJ138_02245, partial [Kiritimatiellae bacterium]|nr:hypothetical protein [Kiritimatiellia bacterium]
MTSGLERFGTVARNYAAGQGENAAAAARGENAAIVFGEDGSELRGSAKRDAYRRWRNPTDEEMRLSIAENNKVRKEFLRQVQAHFTERGVVTIPRAVLKHLKLGDYKLDADGNVTSGKPLTARRICLVMRAIETVDASRAQALERANPLANEALDDADVGESFAGLVEKHALDEDTAAALRNLLDGFARNLARELVRDPGVDLQDAKNRVQDGMMGLLEQLDRFLGDRSVPRNDALGLLRSPLASYAAFTRPNVMHAGTFRMLKFLLDHPGLHAGEPQELFDLLNRLDGVPARLLGADVERDLATAWDRHCGKVAETVNSHPAKPWTVRTVVRNLGLMGDAKLAQAFTGANFKSFLENVKDAYRKQMTNAAKLPPPGGPGADDADLRRVVCDLALKHVLSARTDDARLVSAFVGTAAMDCALARVALAAGDSSGLSRILEQFDQFVQDSALNREALNRGVDEKFQDLENKLKAELGDLADSVNTDFVREKMKSARSVEEAQDAADRFLAKVKELADLLKVGVSKAVAGALMKAVTGDKAFSMATAKLAADFVSSEDGMRLMGDLGRVRGTHDLWEKLNEIAGRILERGDQNAVREIGSDPGLRGQVLAFVMLTALDADPELGGKLEEMRTTVAGLYDQKFPEFRKRDDDAPQPGDLAAALKGETAFDLLGQLKSCMDSA